MMEMPPELDRAWHARGYYGSPIHNVKAIYQRYLGWYRTPTRRTYGSIPRRRPGHGTCKPSAA